MTRGLWASCGIAQEGKPAQPSSYVDFRQDNTGTCTALKLHTSLETHQAMHFSGHNRGGNKN